MRKSLAAILAVLALSLLVGAVNNAFREHKIDWIGSPEILQRPWDTKDEPHAIGFQKGIRYALRQGEKEAMPIALGAVLVVAGSLVLRRKLRWSWGLVAERWFAVGMAAMFFSACWYKLEDPSEFATAVAQYRMLPEKLVDAFSLFLPAFELVLGVLLLSGRYKREAYALTTGLWVMFIAALSQALYRRLGITCGCFAIQGVEASVGETWFSLIRDVVLLAPTLLFLFWQPQREARPAAAAVPQRDGALA
jgi:Methylamine utilisation protein MauE